MTVSEAKSLVLQRIYEDIKQSGVPAQVNPNSPDPSDPGKFSINNQAARVIHHFSGWHVPIALSWFGGSYDKPKINRDNFHWYVFAIPTFDRYKSTHYLIVDYLQMRDWVLEFEAPKGNDHRDHSDWLANVVVDRKVSNETEAYFRWGDEPAGVYKYLSRVVRLDNIEAAANQQLLASLGKKVGAVGANGESEAHRRLKLYVSQRPTLLGLRETAISEIEHSFCTGDRVDVLFNNHGPKRCVVEVELESPEGILVGIHQAIKYRSLAAAESMLPIKLPDVDGLVVSYGKADSSCIELAAPYDIRLLQVEKDKVLEPVL
jgi:hypothetical protein